MIMLAGQAGALPLNETPGSQTAIVFEPYAFSYYPSAQAQFTLNDQGYDWTHAANLFLDTDPEVTIADFEEHLQAGYGVFFLGTHGNCTGERGWAIELYEYTSEGKCARDGAYDAYLDAGWDSTEIYKWQRDNQDWHIGIQPAAVATRFEPASTIVYDASCCSDRRRSAWVGYRDFLGYDEETLMTVAIADADTFWNWLNGESWKDLRVVENAANGVTILHDGAGNTVLSPTVASYEPTEDWLYYEPETPVSFEGRITFDCTMWQNQASTVLSDSGPCEIVNPVWVNDHELSFEIEPSGEGHGYIRVSAAEAESEGNRANLDGNQDPDSTDGTGPNNDDWKMYYWFRDDDPWALVDEVRIEEGELLWRVSREVNTLGYRVLATNDRASDEWTLVEEVPARGGGEYRVSIPEGWAYFQLQEKEKTSAGSVWNYLESGPTRAFYVEGPGSRSGRSQRRWPLHVIGLPSAAEEMAEYVRGSRMRGVEADYETVTSLNPELLRPLMAAERSRGRIPVVWPARSSPAAQGVRGAPMEQTTIYLVARGDLGYSGAERLGGRRSHRRAATGGLTVDRLQPEAIRLLGAGRALVAVVLPAGPGRRAGRLEQTCRYPGDVVSLCGRRLLPV